MPSFLQSLCREVGVLACAVFLLFGVTPLRAEPVLKVGVYAQPPDITLDEAGNLRGIFGEILVEIAREEGWTLASQSCHWSDCLQALQAGNIDLLPNVFYSPERARVLQFHHAPVLQTWSQVYAPKGHAFLRLEDMQGRRLAVLERSAQHDYLEVLLPALDVDITLVPFKVPEDGFRKVHAGRADAVIFNHMFGEINAARYELVPTPIILQPVSAYFGASPTLDAALLARIDERLVAWQADPDSVYYEILRHWMQPEARTAESPRDALLLFVLGGLLLIFLGLAWLFWYFQRSERRRLRTSERRLQAVLGSVDALIAIKDTERRYLYVNTALAEFYGQTPAAMLMRRAHDFIKDSASLRTVERADDQTLNLGQRSATRESLKSPRTGQLHQFLSVRLPLLSAQGRMEGLAIILTDITEQLQVDEQTHRLTFYDTLTDLPNRRMLISRLGQTLETARKGEAIGALLTLDLDGFRKINETLGFQAGDMILREVARRLVTHTRARDTVSRISADEFMILFTDVGSGVAAAARNALQQAEGLRRVLSADLFRVADQTCVLSASFGLTLITPECADSDTLIHEADLAMQRAREQGGGRIVFYEQTLQDAVEARQWLERDLTQAVSTPAYYMVIQPQFASDGSVVGAELLSRWHHPRRGLISPELFIAVAEESGLIHHLTETTLAHACRVARELAAAGQDYPVSVNISPKVLAEPGFAQKVAQLLTQYGMPAQRLVFEITEGVLVDGCGPSMVELQALHALGVGLSIDDFGTGYSNLASLTRLSIQELKIDQSLVNGVGQGLRQNDEIVGLIVDMAQRLGFRVVAEGVEHERQARFLYALGCSALQGHLLARPMTIAQWLIRLPQAPAGEPASGQ